MKILSYNPKQRLKHSPYDYYYIWSEIQVFLNLCTRIKSIKNKTSLETKSLLNKDKKNKIIMIKK